MDVFTKYKGKSYVNLGALNLSALRAIEKSLRKSLKTAEKYGWNTTEIKGGLEIVDAKITSEIRAQEVLKGL